jgi:uncharacterized protein YllA (UPF0747 family)
VREIVAGRFAVRNAPEGIIPTADREIFDGAGDMLNETFARLLPHVERIDPNLAKTHRRSAGQALRALDRLRERTFRVLMSREGLSKKQIQALRNAVLPLGLMQERVFPLPHFIANFGAGFVRAVFSAGDLHDFSHNLLIMEEDDE